MTLVDWLVVVGGAAAIVWVNWYFFVAGPDHATSDRAGRQEADD